MPFSKLKNLILLLLVLVNALLLALVVPVRMETIKQRAETGQRLESLFASYDLTLDSTILPDSLALTPMELEPDDQAAKAAAAALLGSEPEAEDGAGRMTTVYRAAHGSCNVSRSGSFSAALAGGSPTDAMEKTVTALMDDMGVQTASVSSPVRLSAGIYSVSAEQELAGAPVFSAVLTFTFRNGTLGAVDGSVHLTGGAVKAVSDGGKCISCADALTAFLASRDTLGWVGSAITAVRQGYVRADTASAAVVRLTPGWMVSTDVGSFWVNGLTREVSNFSM